MKSVSFPSRTTKRYRRGFTLVEMLVATALTLMIMLMFAQIYSAAISTITDQRAIANNDAKARTLNAIIRADLDKLTFRQNQDDTTPRGILPLAPGDSPDPDRQRGYLYISENAVGDDTDDVFQATISMAPNERSQVEQTLFGRATSLDSNFFNEPDRDDGVINNKLTASSAGEVAYFLRNGNLYRRQTLLRNPLRPPLDAPDFSSQPSQQPTSTDPYWAPASQTSLFGNNYTSPTSDSYYHDFDTVGTRIADPANNDSYFAMLGLESLSNNTSATSTHPIAWPRYRFGFFPFPSTLAVATNGLAKPFEHDSTGQFIGRFLHAETSNSDFTYPGRLFPGDTTDPSAGGGLTLNSAGRVSKFDTGSSSAVYGTRISEDLVLSNVSQFNIEVWDSLRVDWVDLGDSIGGYFDASNRTNPNYGPRGSTTPSENRVFDTWHPELGVAPPFRPIKQLSTWTWQQNYGLPPNLLPVGALVFPSSGNTAFIYRLIRRGEDVNGNGMQDTGEGDIDSDGTFDQGLTGSTEPNWPREHGLRVHENLGTANEIIWEAVENRVGLEAIRFTIRYLDLGSGQERQLTIVHSFVED